MGDEPDVDGATFGVGTVGAAPPATPTERSALPESWMAAGLGSMSVR